MHIRNLEVRTLDLNDKRYQNIAYNMAQRGAIATYRRDVGWPSSCAIWFKW